MINVSLSDLALMTSYSKRRTLTSQHLFKLSIDVVAAYRIKDACVDGGFSPRESDRRSIPQPWGWRRNQQSLHLCADLLVPEDFALRLQLGRRLLRSPSRVRRPDLRGGSLASTDSDAPGHRRLIHLHIIEDPTRTTTTTTLITTIVTGLEPALPGVAGAPNASTADKKKLMVLSAALYRGSGSKDLLRNLGSAKPCQAETRLHRCPPVATRLFTGVRGGIALVVGATCVERTRYPPFHRSHSA